MNTKTKKRLFIVTGFIVIVLVVALAFVGGSMAAKSVSVAQALTGQYEDQKIQVTGNVVQNSFQTNQDTLTFSIYDPEGNETDQLKISFEGAVSATFGNNVTAICTGKIKEGNILHASELVTKCPSKYESATDALEVSSLLEYGESMVGNPVKVSGTVADGTLKPAGGNQRFVLNDNEKENELSIKFDDALPEGIEEGTVVVLVGHITTEGSFEATDVALRS